MVKKQTFRGKAASSENGPCAIDADGSESLLGSEGAGAQEGRCGGASHFAVGRLKSCAMVSNTIKSLANAKRRFGKEGTNYAVEFRFCGTRTRSKFQAGNFKVAINLGETDPARFEVNFCSCSEAEQPIHTQVNPGQPFRLKNFDFVMAGLLRELRGWPQLCFLRNFAYARKIPFGALFFLTFGLCC